MRPFLILLLLLSAVLSSSAGSTFVVDSVSGQRLSSASIFNSKGKLIGVCSRKGKVPYIPDESYPITIRCMGYEEKTCKKLPDGDIKLTEIPYELPEVEIAGTDKNILHLLALIREYSTLTTYTDTVFMFREKWVDYMVPEKGSRKFKGWKTPRVLSAKSYYRFTNLNGLDSVSDRFNQHFSWSDWIRVVDDFPFPKALADSETATDTVKGRYGPTEIWNKRSEQVTVDVDVLADTASRRWLPDMAEFFNKGVDFDLFKVHYGFSNVVSAKLEARDISGMTCNIESRGRGRDMFRFNRRDQPFFVSTYAEFYFADREYINAKEAKKWEKAVFDEEAILALPKPANVPEIQPSITRLIARIENINHNDLRLKMAPNQQYVRPDFVPLTTTQKIFKRLKSMIGIKS